MPAALKHRGPTLAKGNRFGIWKNNAVSPHSGPGLGSGILRDVIAVSLTAKARKVIADVKGTSAFWADIAGNFRCEARLATRTIKVEYFGHIGKIAARGFVRQGRVLRSHEKHCLASAEHVMMWPACQVQKIPLGSSFAQRFP